MVVFVLCWLIMDGEEDNVVGERFCSEVVAIGVVKRFLFSCSGEGDRSHRYVERSFGTAGQCKFCTRLSILVVVCCLLLLCVTVVCCYIMMLDVNAMCHC